jgi:hypothetical protein
VNSTQGTVHIYFAGGVKDGDIETMVNPPDVIRVPIDETEDTITYHEYIKRNVSAPTQDYALRGQQGLWAFAGVKWHDKPKEA